MGVVAYVGVVFVVNLRRVVRVGVVRDNGGVSYYVDLMVGVVFQSWS